MAVQPVSAQHDVGPGYLALISFGRFARHRLAMRELNEPNLRVAVHRGPAMVATINDHLDYFGATISTAEQLLATAQHGSATQLVVSNAIAMDEAVAETIAARQLAFLVEHQLPEAPQVWLHRVQPAETVKKTVVRKMEN